ncbi:MAG: hypothetical protein FD180_4650 [Planctomycetota bacterium]|nr:MAG: hypothetical protein FD180_4650 [Planctomycetota bacterium]
MEPVEPGNAARDGEGSAPASDKDRLLPPAGEAPGARLHCPQCGASWPAGTVLCVRCGMNLLTGERTAPPPASPTLEEEPETRLERFAGRFPGLFRPKTLVLSLIVLAMAACCFVLCIVLLSMGVVMTAATAGGVGLILYAQAVAWILTGEIQLLVEAMTEFDGPRWNAFILALIIPLTLALVFMGLKPKA